MNTNGPAQVCCLCVLLVFVVVSSQSMPDPRDANFFDCDNTHLFKNVILLDLSVSPIIRPKPRLLELNWEVSTDFTVEDDDTIELWYTNASTNASTRPVEVVQVSSDRGQRGYLRSSLQFDDQWLGEPFRTRCSPYQIVYRRRNNTLASNCLRQRPDWMWAISDALWNRTLRECFLPGTHDSGAYSCHPTGDFGEKLVINQHQSVWTQLVMGVRFLDLRIGHRANNTQDKFWIFHGPVAVRPFSEVVDDIEKFMNVTKEIVIVDFHRFPAGFNNKIHERFVALLESRLGRWMNHNVTQVTLGALWLRDARLVVGYAHAASVRNHPHTLWPNVRHAWGNKQNVTSLLTFIDHQMTVVIQPRSLWAAMVQLTPRFYYFLPLYPGLTQLAMRVNRHVTLRSRRQWWSQANIVASDFFLGNDVVSVAVSANLKRDACFV